MSGTTLTGTILTRVTLSNPATQNPATVVAGAFLGAGLFGAAGTAWTIDNFGHVTYGITLASGGLLTNDAGGRIEHAYYAGVKILGAAGIVVNAGTIAGGSFTGYRDYQYAGVALYAGGTVHNGSPTNMSASITSVLVVGQGSLENWGRLGYARLGAGTVTNMGLVGPGFGGEDGIAIAGAGGVANLGSVQGGISLAAGGSVANLGTLADIRGGSGVHIAGGAGTVVNQGRIDGTYGSGQGTVLLEAGGLVDNQGSLAGIIGVRIGGAAGSLTNTGTIDGLVDFQKGGRVENHGVLGSLNGVRIRGGGGTVVNTGTIAGSLLAVSLAPGVTNRLVAAPGAVFAGIADGGNLPGGARVSTLELAAGAGRGTLAGFGSQFINFAAIEVAAGASWALARGTTLGPQATLTNRGTLATRRDLSVAGAVVNTGTITGSGVVLEAGGSVLNWQSGVISGPTGVRVESGAAVVNNFGTIAAPNGSAAAVRFADADGNLAVVHPGAVFVGQVRGGAGQDTLELAGGAGTVAWLGAHYVGFETLSLQPGAHWRMTGLNTLPDDATLAIAFGSTLSVAGTLRVAGDVGLARLGSLAALPTGAIVIGNAPASSGAITVAAGQQVSGIGALKAASIVDAGTIVASGGALRLVGSLSGTGTVAIDSHAIMAIYGAVGLPRITFLPGDGQTLLLGEPGSVAATIDGFGATDAIDLHGIGLATALDFSGDTLTLSAPAGAVTLHFAGPYQAGGFAIADDGRGGTLLTYT